MGEDEVRVDVAEQLYGASVEAQFARRTNGHAAIIVELHAARAAS